MMTYRRAFIGGFMGLGLGACGKVGGSKANVQSLPEITWPLKDFVPSAVGCCVMLHQLKDPQYKQLLLENFNQITPEFEMKMEVICQANGLMDFTRPDQIAGFARDNGLRLHGTTINWYAEDPPYFQSLKSSPSEFKSQYIHYIRTLVSRYRGLCSGWDVLNEPVAEDGDGYRGGIWTEVLGEDVWRLIFDTARENDSRSILFINDYHLESKPKKLDSYLRLIERLLKQNVPIGGIGTQCHADIAMPKGGMKKAVKEIAEFGLPIHISELDVSLVVEKPLLMTTQEKAMAQARVFEEAAEAFLDIEPSKRYAFTLWGLRDKDSWIRGQPDGGNDMPLIFDDNGRPKPLKQALARGFLGPHH
jgi:endo-1,4-beta-xylanase